MAAIKCIDYVICELDNGNNPIGIYLDLSKSFNTINCNILLYKLKKHGIKGNAFKLILSYLTDMEQFVIFDTIRSDFVNIDTGVPQDQSILYFSVFTLMT